MSFRHRLLLLFSPFLFFSFLVVVSNTEAARIKVKKVEALNERNDVAFSRLDSRQRPLQPEEEYLVWELSYAGIDCSAFVKKVFSSLSLPLPRTAREQYALGKDVPPGELQKGDLLFYHTYAGFPSHVGIYIGNDLMIHPSSEGGRVMISRMNTPYFLSRFIGARRIPSDGGGFLWELAARGGVENGGFNLRAGFDAAPVLNGQAAFLAQDIKQPV